MNKSEVGQEVYARRKTYYDEPPFSYKDFLRDYPTGIAFVHNTFDFGGCNIGKQGNTYTFNFSDLSPIYTHEDAK